MKQPFIIDTDSGTVIPLSTAKLVYLSETECMDFLELSDSERIDYAEECGKELGIYQ